jgi:hypothetical protein
MSRGWDGSAPGDQSEVRAIGPHGGVHGGLATIKPERSPVFIGHVDALGFLQDPWRRSDQESVGLARRPRPGPQAGRSPGGSAGEFTPFAATRTCRRGRVGGTTDPVVTRAAVPDAGARPPTTRPSPPGADAAILWSVHQPRVATGQSPSSSPGVLVRRSGRQDEHLATRPPIGRCPTPPPLHRSAQRAAPHPRPDGDSTGASSGLAARISDRSNARAPENRANPANSRPSGGRRRAEPARAKRA